MSQCYCSATCRCVACHLPPLHPESPIGFIQSLLVREIVEQFPGAELKDCVRPMDLWRLYTREWYSRHPPSDRIMGRNTFFEELRQYFPRRRSNGLRYAGLLPGPTWDDPPPPPPLPSPSPPSPPSPASESSPTPIEAGEFISQENDMPDSLFLDFGALDKFPQGESPAP